jgi:hypothetical protein
MTDPGQTPEATHPAGPSTGEVGHAARPEPHITSASSVTSAGPDESAKAAAGKMVPGNDTPDFSRAPPAAAPQVAMIAKGEPFKGTEPDIGKLIFDDAHLPMTFPNGWVLDRRRDRLDGVTRCLLLSPKQPIFDGYEQSRVQLQVTTRALLVMAGSNIDASYPNQGVRVDNRALVPFQHKLVDKRSAFASGPVQSSMAAGRNLTVALGFWPTWPVTKTQQTTFNLTGFGSAYAALQACSKQ